MSELERLAKRCKGSVSVTFNQHRDYYEAVDEYMAREGDDVADAMLSAMIAGDTVAELQFYPLSPTGFHIVYGLDLGAMIAKAHAILDEEGA